MKTVGDRLAELLVENGVNRVFGLPGGQTLPLYEGIRKQNHRIQHILTRDERSAGFAADAYARLTKKVGVCDATVGPGATNLVSPFAEAFCASIPILGIISDIPRAWEYRRNRGNASQAINQLDMFKSVTKWQAAITDPTAVDDTIETAFRVATTGKPGPVVISVPVDVGEMAYEPTTPKKQVGGAGFPRYRFAPDPDSIRAVLKLLSDAKKPVLVVGGGAQISGAYDVTRKLVSQLNIPIVTTISGKGIIAESTPLSFGVVGTFGNDVANEILKQADFIFYIGCKIGQLTTMRFLYPDQSVRIAHLDIDPEEIGRNYPACLPIVSDVRLGLQALLNELDAQSISRRWDWDCSGLREQKNEWDGYGLLESVQKVSPVKPQAVMSLINQVLADDDLVVCDASLSSGWASARLSLPTAGLSYLAPRGLASLGWGAPAAIGASLAVDRKRKVFLFAGDGGFGYSVQELETMARLKLPILIIIFNNSTLGWIKHIQRDLYAEKYLSTDFNKVDFATVAKGFGVESVSVDTIEELKNNLDKYQEIKGTVLLDVLTDQWESPVRVYES